MNCFPCKGPACNSCGKYDRIQAMVAADNDIRCASCGGKVDLATGACSQCGHVLLAAPGESAFAIESPSFHSAD